MDGWRTVEEIETVVEVGRDFTCKCLEKERYSFFKATPLASQFV